MKERLAKIQRRQQKPKKLAVAAAAVKNYVDQVELALQVAQDKRFGKRLFSGLEHGAQAWRRARRGSGLAGAAKRLAVDRAVHTELRNAQGDLQRAYARVDAKKRGHRLITATAGLTVAGFAALAAAPKVRERFSALLATASRNSRQLQDLASANGLVRHEARPGKLDDLTKEKLYARAQEAEIPGRSEMSKEELIDALRAKS